MGRAHRNKNRRQTKKEIIRMQMSREQFEQLTGERLPRDQELVTRGDMMPQNGQNYGQQNWHPVQPNSQPMQMGQPMGQNVPQGQPVQLGQNTLLPEHVPDKQFSLKSFVPLFAGIIGLLTIGRLSGSLAAMSLGFGIMGTGILCRREMDDYKPERKLKALMTAIGGGAVGAAGLVTLFVPSLSLHMSSLILTLSGIILIGTPPVTRHMKLRRCTEKTRAVCIGNRQKRGGKHHNMMYAPIWQYIAGGRAYTAYDDVYTSPQQFYEGQGTDIMVNPNDPRDIYRGSDPSAWALMVFGALMLGGGVICLLRLFGIF